MREIGLIVSVARLWGKMVTWWTGIQRIRGATDDRWSPPQLETLALFNSHYTIPQQFSINSVWYYFITNFYAWLSSDLWCALNRVCSQKWESLSLWQREQCDWFVQWEPWQPMEMVKVWGVRGVSSDRVRRGRLGNMGGWLCHLQNHRSSDNQWQ